MGSYYIPSNKLKGEGRILYIFTVKALIYTAAFAFVGLIFFLIFQACGLKNVGIVILVIFALIGYALGSIKIPETGNTKLIRNHGGDYIDEIIIKYINFNKNRKVYTYGTPREDPTYSSIQTMSFDIFNLGGKAEQNNMPGGTEISTKGEK